MGTNKAVLCVQMIDCYKIPGKLCTSILTSELVEVQVQWWQEGKGSSLFYVLLSTSSLWSVISG